MSIFWDLEDWQVILIQVSDRELKLHHSANYHLTKVLHMKMTHFLSGSRHVISPNPPPPYSADCIYLITYPFQYISYYVFYNPFHPKNGITEKIYDNIEQKTKLRLNRLSNSTYNFTGQEL